MAILFLLLLLNLVISFWNASSVGRYWTERHDLPGFTRFMMWCGVIMAVAGFFSVYVAVITMVMYDLNAFAWLGYQIFKVELSPAEIDMLVQNVFDLAYLTIVFPVLGTGLAITLNSWIVAYQRRTLGSAAVGLYNTGAQIHNMVNAVRHVPQATRSLGKGLSKSFSSKNSSKGIAYLALMLFPITISLGGAIATTALVMSASDARWDLDEVVTE